MVAGLSGTMKMAIRKSIVSFRLQNEDEKNVASIDRISLKIDVNSAARSMGTATFKRSSFAWKCASTSPKVWLFSLLKTWIAASANTSVSAARSISILTDGGAFR